MARYKEAKFDLKTTLKEHNLTQYKLAKIMGVDSNQISVWVKKNHNPTLKTLNKIAKAIGCKVPDLLDY